MFILDKKYLKRNEFVNLADSKKIWSKTMTIDEVLELFEYLENSISKYEFETDKNFIMNSRRKGLKLKIEERLLKYDENTDDVILESLFNFWEFVSDEYFGNFTSISNELGLSIEELTNRDNEYRKKGIICIQERDIILDIIREIKCYINKKI